LDTAFSVSPKNRTRADPQLTKNYPQVKRPVDEQLPDELTVPDCDDQPEAKVEIILLVSLLWQRGHSGVRCTAEKGTIFSNFVSHE
jgi:hypothetical protein